MSQLRLVEARRSAAVELPPGLGGDRARDLAGERVLGVRLAVEQWRAAAGRKPRSRNSCALVLP
jgi:hypothetical protein